MVQINLRPPPSLEFVQGYPGIPSGKDRPFASVKGIVEIRSDGYEEVKAKWVQIELQKKEILPGGGLDNTFIDTIQSSPVSLWTATSDECETLNEGDFPFSLRLPESIPPSVRLERGAGIVYQLVASVYIGKKTWYGNMKADILRVEETIIIDKHDLHSTWPIYNQHEIRQVTLTNSIGTTLSVERNCNCSGPGAVISILAIIAQNELHTVVCNRLELSILEITVFRRPYTQRKKIPPQATTKIIASSQVDVNFVVKWGMQCKAELQCKITEDHATPTISTARFVDIEYVLEVKAFLGSTFLHMKLPIIMSNWLRNVSIEAVRRIGPAQSLTPILASEEEVAHAAPRTFSPPAYDTLQTHPRHRLNPPRYENNSANTTVDREIIYTAAQLAAPRIQRQPLKADEGTRRLYQEAQAAVMRATSEPSSSSLISVNDSQSPAGLIADTLVTNNHDTQHSNARAVSADALESSLTGSEPGFSQLVVDGVMQVEDSVVDDCDQHGTKPFTAANGAKVAPSVPQRPTLVDLTGLISREDNVAKGGGGFADVYKGLLTDHKQVQTYVAIKVIRSHIYTEKSRNKILKRLRREIRVWSGLKHPSILSLLGTSMDFGPYEAMVCPWMQDGDLNRFLENSSQTLTLSQRFDILSDVSDGLAYLHSRAIIHGDLTSANILMDNGRAYLCDFGLSNIMVEFQVTSLITSTVAGACRWAAPELFPVGTVDEMQPTITKACDIYSFGSITLQVISGHRPYEDLQRNEQVLLEMFFGRLPSRPTEPLLDDECWEFINNCWKRNPVERPDITVVMQKLYQVRSGYPAQILASLLRDV